MEQLVRIPFRTETNESLIQNLTPFEKYLKKIIFNILKDSGEVEDVYQEVMQKIFASWDAFRGENFKGWIARIAVNHSINYKKKLAVEREQAILEDEQLQPASTDPAAEWIISPREIFTRKEQAEAVMRIIDALPQDYRALVIEYYGSDLSINEIAGKFNLNVRTAETRIYRAKKMIAEKWRNHAH